MLLQGDLVTVQVAASWCRLVLFGSLVQVGVV